MSLGVKPAAFKLWFTGYVCQHHLFHGHFVFCFLAQLLSESCLQASIAKSVLSVAQVCNTTSVYSFCAVMACSPPQMLVLICVHRSAAHASTTAMLALQTWYRCLHSASSSTCMQATCPILCVCVHSCAASSRQACAALQISLVEMPSFSFNINVYGGDITFLPGVEKWINWFIETRVLRPFVLPERLTVPVKFLYDPTLEVSACLNVCCSSRQDNVRF